MSISVPQRQTGRTLASLAYLVGEKKSRAKGFLTMLCLRKCYERVYHDTNEFITTRKSLSRHERVYHERVYHEVRKSLSRCRVHFLTMFRRRWFQPRNLSGMVAS